VRCSGGVVGGGVLVGGVIGGGGVVNGLWGSMVGLSFAMSIMLSSRQG